MMKNTLSLSSLRHGLRSLWWIAAFAMMLTAGAANSATPPKVGDIAPNFTLKTLEDRPVELNALVRERPVVLVVLRGWPGYQCPLCTRQVQEYVGKAADFKQRGAKVVMIYPGPAEKLWEYARDFLREKQWPADFEFVMDPDYRFTNAYGLRWDAPRETVYPSTFVIERGEAVFVSRT